MMPPLHRDPRTTPRVLASSPTDRGTAARMGRSGPESRRGISEYSPAPENASGGRSEPHRPFRRPRKDAASTISSPHGTSHSPLPTGEVDRERFSSPPGAFQGALSLRERRASARASRSGAGGRRPTAFPGARNPAAANPQSRQSVPVFKFFDFPRAPNKPQMDYPIFPRPETSRDADSRFSSAFPPAAAAILDFLPPSDEPRPRFPIFSSPASKPSVFLAISSSRGSEPPASSPISSSPAAEPPASPAIFPSSTPEPSASVRIFPWRAPSDRTAANAARSRSSIDPTRSPAAGTRSGRKSSAPNAARSRSSIDRTLPPAAVLDSLGYHRETSVSAPAGCHANRERRCRNEPSYRRPPSRQRTPRRAAGGDLRFIEGRLRRCRSRAACR